MTNDHEPSFAFTIDPYHGDFPYQRPCLTMAWSLKPGEVGLGSPWGATSALQAAGNSPGPSTKSAHFQWVNQRDQW